MYTYNRGDAVDQLIYQLFSGFTILYLYKIERREGVRGWFGKIKIQDSIFSENSSKLILNTKVIRVPSDFPVSNSMIFLLTLTFINGKILYKIERRGREWLSYLVRIQNSAFTESFDLKP